MAGRAAPDHHRRRACRGRQDRAADPARGPLRVSPACRSRRRRSRSPITPFRAAGADAHGASTARSRAYVRCARARAARGLRRRRDHGLRGLPHQPVHRAADQPSRRRMGRRVREPHPLLRSRSCAGRATRSGRDFIIIYRLSMLDLVEGGSTWDEVVALAQAVEAAGATIINTGIGWHEARIPTIATMVPRAAFAWVTRRLKGEVAIPLDHDQPHQRSGDRRRRCSRAATPTWCRWRGRFSPIAEFVNKAARDRADEINTCIALQPGVPRPHLRARDRVLPRQSLRVPRDGADADAGARAAQAVAVVGAGPAGLAAATTAAERGHARHAVRCRERDRRPVQPRAAHSRQGGVRRDAALFPHAARAARRRRRASNRRVEARRSRAASTT